jgi:hypothetical protein
MPPRKNESKGTAKRKQRFVNDELNTSSSSKQPFNSMRRTSRTSSKATVPLPTNV